MVSPAVENRRKWFPGRLHPVAITGSPGPQISSGNLSSLIERQSACVGHVLTAHATDDRAARHPDRPNLSTHARTAGRPPLRSIR